MPRTKKAAKAKPTIAEKLPTMTQIDGKDYTAGAQIQVSKKKSLDEIWGRKYSKFKTINFEEYAERLRRMTKLDLQQECIKVGLMPHDKRDTMVERLSKECRKYLAAASSVGLQPVVLKLSDAGRTVLHKSGNSLV